MIGGRRHGRWFAVLGCVAGVGALLIPTMASVATAAPGGHDGSGLFGHIVLSGAGANAWLASPHTLPATVQVVATGLNQPRKITIGPDGDLLVSEAGTNDVPAGCVTGTEAACADPSGAIARVTPGGQVSTLVWAAVDQQRHRKRSRRRWAFGHHGRQRQDPVPHPELRHQQRHR